MSIRKSPVWNVFTESDEFEGTAICNICSQKFSFRTSTTNLFKHVKRKHPEINIILNSPINIKDQENKGLPDLLPKGIEIIVEDACDTDPPKEELESSSDDDSTVNSYQNVSSTWSSVWKYFTKISDQIGSCNFCQSEISYNLNTSNLKKHLIDKHKRFDDELEENLSAKLDSEEDRNSSGTNLRLWELFTKIPHSNLEACCNICKSQLSYKNTTFNLKKHLERKHPAVLMNVDEDERQFLFIEKPLKEEILDSFEDNLEEEPFIHKINFNNEMNNKRSQIWNVFTIKSASECIATCNVCNQQFSYKSTTNDLKKHFQRKHPNFSIEHKVEQIEVKFEPDESSNDENRDFVNGKMSKKHSILWNYFTESSHDEYLATCNICKKKLCYKTTTTNLRKHLNSKHPHVRINLTDDTERNRFRQWEIVRSNKDNKHADSFKKTKYYSTIWNHFTRNKPKEYLATCNVCGRELCYRTSITNLKKHMSKMHVEIKINAEEEIFERESKQSTSLNQNSCSEITDTESPLTTIKKERRHYSKLWNYFTRKKPDECVASCNICHKEIGYRTSTSNLKKHLVNLHPDIDFHLETEIHQNQINGGSIKTCLICLQNNRDLPKMFFHIGNADLEENSYVTKIGEILNEDVVIDESHVICQSCIEDIEKVYQFKQKISKAFNFWSKLESELETESYALNTNNPDQSELENNLAKFTCDRCHQEFESAYIMLNHTCIRESTCNNPGEEDTKPFKFTCQICGTVFNKQWKKDRHLKRCRYPVEKKFACTLCVKSYKSSFLLREHMSTHTGERNYMCHLCGKTFHRASVRHRHLQNHNLKPGEKIKRKQFLCFVCGKTFPANVATRHMRMHSGIKRKECNICFKRFDQLAHLKVHLRAHTGERPYECKICSRRFSLAATLRKHLRLHVDTVYLMTDGAQEMSTGIQEIKMEKDELN